MNLSGVRERSYFRCEMDNPEKASNTSASATVLFMLTFLLPPVISPAQVDESQEPKFIMKGYLKNTVSASVLEDSTLWDNLVHNRLNFKWYPNPNLSGFVDFRNRIFFGDQVKSVNKLAETFPGLVPRYSQLIDENNDFFDLSWTIVDENGLVVQSMIDRLYLEWLKNDWEVTLGRQRINWGQNLVWNPNDLFNAYSFLDFDYEERPGSDALRVTRYTGAASQVEFAINAADTSANFVAAGLWKINVSKYDIQFLGGYHRGDLAIGTGWAGNIRTSGFKGEITYFQHLHDNGTDALVTSLSWDYSFKSSLYILISGLHNTGAEVDPVGGGLIDLQLGQLTAKELSPYRYNLLAQASYQFNPLVFGSLATIFYPGANALVVFPTLTVNALQNLDLDLVVQGFYDDRSGDFKALVRSFFLRVKWSF